MRFYASRFSPREQILSCRHVMSNIRTTPATPSRLKE
jgi:hypothetical protein